MDVEETLSAAHLSTTQYKAKVEPQSEQVDEGSHAQEEIDKMVVNENDLLDIPTAVPASLDSHLTSCSTLTSGN